MAKLLVDENGARRVVPFVDGAITIGRGSENNVVIRDRKSSRRHCRLLREEDGFVVEDLNSSNGTYLNEQLARREGLRHGDVIAIGEVRMTFVHDEGEDGYSEEVAVAEAPAARSGDADGDLLLEEADPDAPTVTLSKESLEAAVAGAPAPAPYLEISGGDRAGERIPIERTPFTIGRKEGNDLVLVDARASGNHCRIVERDGLWVLEDRDSGNGTLVGKRRIERHTLRRGDRLTVGATKLVFDGVDTPVDAARGPAGGRGAAQVLRVVDEGEFSEDDISRLDVQRVIERASPYQAIFTGIFVVALVAVLVFGWQVADRFAASRSGIDPDNRLTLNPSFERPADGPGVVGWRLQPAAADGATLAVVERERRTRHGKSLLRLDVGAAIEGGFVRVESEESFDIQEGQAVRVGGQIRNGSFALAALEVIWLQRDGSGLREVESSISTPILAGASFRSLEALFTPPPGGRAEKLRLAIFALGKGLLEADDLSVKIEPAGATEGPIEQTLAEGDDDGRELTFRFRDDGSFGVSRGQNRLLRNVRFAAPASGALPFGQLVALNTEPPSALESGSLRGSFAFLAGGQRETVVEQLSGPGGAGHGVRWQVLPWSDAESLEFGVAVELGRRAETTMALYAGGVAVAQGGITELEGATGDEWVLGRDVRQLILSFSTPMKLELLPATRSRTGATTVWLSPPGSLPGGVLELYVATVSTREQEGIAGLIDRIDGLIAERREGEALALVKELTTSFAHVDDARSAGERREAIIVGAVAAALDEVRAVVDEAERLASAPIRDVLAARVAEFSRRFAGLEEVAEARRLGASVGGGSSGLETPGSEAARILESGQEHFRAARDHLARYYFEWIIEGHPDSPEVAEARRHLGLLEARHGGEADDGSERRRRRCRQDRHPGRVAQG